MESRQTQFQYNCKSQDPNNRDQITWVATNNKDKLQNQESENYFHLEK